MPADESVVSDTSPLLNLALIDRLDLLETQFARDAPDLRRLREQGFLNVVSVDRTDLYVEIAHELDAGETAAITYAIETGAELVLLDERDVRRVARRHDLDVTGVIGILLRGVREGTVDLQAELDALRNAGFWISDDLYADVLRRGEDIE